MPLTLSDSDTLLNSKEAAAYLRLSPKNGEQTIKRWVREGRIRAGHAGDLIRFRMKDLEDFLFLNHKKRR